MLFTDKLEEVRLKVVPEFDRLFVEILKNQTHECDLLLVQENGFYNPETHDWKAGGKKWSPYMIGLGAEGLSSKTHYEFINDYRTSAITGMRHAEYLKAIEYSPEKKVEIGKIKKAEVQMIQIEMLIYLKIWEADSFIKFFYQLVSIFHGEEYDWHFKIKETNRDKNATDKRDILIRKKIRDRLKERFPEIYIAFKKSYLTQVRNSIAHSKYSILNREILLNNHIKGDKGTPIKTLSFDKWIEMFHNTMILYNEQIRFKRLSRDYYSKFAKASGNKVQVRINRIDPQIETITKNLIYTKVKEDFGRWTWEQND